MKCSRPIRAFTPTTRRRCMRSWNPRNRRRTGTAEDHLRCGLWQRAHDRISLPAQEGKTAVPNRLVFSRRRRHRYDPGPARPPQSEAYDFIIKSGRAVMVPLYKGTYERGDGYQDGAASHNQFVPRSRDRMVQGSGPIIDYLETRPDIDHSKLAFEGASWGAPWEPCFQRWKIALKFVFCLTLAFFSPKLCPRSTTQLRPAGEGSGPDVGWTV